MADTKAVEFIDRSEALIGHDKVRFNTAYMRLIETFGNKVLVVPAAEGFVAVFDDDSAAIYSKQSGLYAADSPEQSGDILTELERQSDMAGKPLQKALVRTFLQELIERDTFFIEDKPPEAT